MQPVAQKRAKYKFDQHLLELSRSKNIECAAKEWLFVEKDKRKGSLCICQHKIESINYMYNSYTKYLIIVGDGCFKKFGLSKKPIDNPLLREVFQDILMTKGEYEIIDDILEYTKHIQMQLIQRIQNEYVKHKNDMVNLAKILDNIKDLLEKYDLNYLHVLYEEIQKHMMNEKIKKEEKRTEEERRIRAEMERINNMKKRQEEERRFRAEMEKRHEEERRFCAEMERISNMKKSEEERRVQAEIERINDKKKKEEEERIARENAERKEEEENAKREYDRIETERKQECMCGIAKGSICCCETPKYILQKNNQLWCVKCNKWKCRC